MTVPIVDVIVWLLFWMSLFVGGISALTLLACIPREFFLLYKRVKNFKAKDLAVEDWIEMEDAAIKRQINISAIVTFLSAAVFIPLGFIMAKFGI